MNEPTDPNLKTQTAIASVFACNVKNGRHVVTPHLFHAWHAPFFFVFAISSTVKNIKFGL